MFGVGSKRTASSPSRPAQSNDIRQVHCPRLRINSSRSRSFNLSAVFALMLAVTGFILGAGSNYPVVQAAEPNPELAEPDIHLVVTASRILQEILETPVAVEVIDREELEAIGGRDLERALRTRTGLSLHSHGGPGSFTSLFLRGAPRTHVLVLVDGVPLDTAFSEAILADIPIAAVDRVEVVRGPASSVWGGRAAGGVIHIITRASSDAPRWDMNVIGKSRGWDARVGHSTTVTAGTTLSLSAQKVSDDGFRESEDYEATRLTARIDRDLSRSRKLDVRVSHVSSNLGTPGSVIDPSPDRQKDNELRWAARLTGDYALFANESRYELQVFGSQLKRSYESPYGKSRHTNHTVGAELSSQTELPNGHAQLALSVRNDNTKSTDLADGGQERLFTAVSGEVLHYLSENLILNSGIRVDMAPTHEPEFSPRLGVRYHRSPAHSYRFVVGRTFRYPTFNELFWEPGGNPALRPEHGWSIEIGGDHQLSRRSDLSWTVFQRRMNDLIAGYPSENIDRTFTQGLEFTVEHSLGTGLRALLTSTFLDARDLKTGDKLDYIPSQEATLQLMQESNSFASSLSARYRGERFGMRFPPWPQPAERVKMPSYFVVDANASWDLGAGRQLKLEVDNLFDLDYEEFPDYPLPGRTIWVGVSYEL